MHDEAGTFDVTKETNAEAGAEVRAFDESGQIGDDKRAAELGAVATGAAVGIDDAEIGVERGERLFCDFWTRCGNHGNQCGLTRVRETNQPNIGEKFELKTKVAFCAGKAFLMFARSLMPGFRKMLIAAATFATLGNQHALSGYGQVSDGFAGLFVISECADGNEQVHVCAGMAAAVRAFAVAAAIGFKFAIVAIAEKRVVVRIRLQINAAAVASITS